jgi:hypothetical protein
MKNLFLLQILFLTLLKTTSAQLVLNANTLSLGCGTDTVNISAAVAPGTGLTGNINYAWNYYTFEINGGNYQFFADTTTQPNYTIITADYLQALQVTAFDNNGNSVSDFIYFANAVQPQIYVQLQGLACDNNCDKTYVVNISNNDAAGYVNIGSQSVFVPAWTPYVSISNVCPGDTFQFVSVTNCVSNRALAYISNAGPAAYELYTQDGGAPNTCSSLSYVFSQSCLPVLSAVITTIDNLPYSGPVNYTIQGDTVVFSSLCAGFYTYELNYGNGITAFGTTTVYDAGMNTFVCTNSSSTPGTNFSCTGSLTATINSTYLPYILYVYNQNLGVIDSVQVTTANYTYALSNACPGYYSLYGGTSMYNAQTIASIPVNNTITYNFTQVNDSASNCYAKDGKITLNYNNLPAGFSVSVSDYTTYYASINLPVNGPLVIDSLAEGTYNINVYDSLYNVYYSSYFQVGVVTPGFNSGATITPLQSTGCGKCFGEVLVTLDTTINAYPFLYYTYGYELISPSQLKLTNLCAGPYTLIVGAGTASSTCFDHITVTVDTVPVNNSLVPVVNNITPASCNTYYAIDGSVELSYTGNSNTTFKWFFGSYNNYSFSDSLSIYNVNFGNYELSLSDSTGCNVVNYFVPFTDTCSSFSVFSARDFNQNCQMDEYNYTQRQFLVNPGNRIVSSFSGFSIPLGNYTVTPLNNANNYCEQSLNLVSDGNDYSYYYSNNFFADSAIYDDVELITFSSYGYAGFIGYWGAYVTNNSANTITTTLSFNVPIPVDSVVIFAANDTSWNIPVSSTLQGNNVTAALSLEPLKQYYYYAYLYPAGELDTVNFVSQVTTTVNYADIDSTNNTSTSDFYYFNNVGWRSSDQSGLYVKGMVSPSATVDNLGSDITYTYQLMNTTNKPINDLVLEVTLSNKLDATTLMFNKNEKINYTYANGKLFIKTSELGLESGKMKTISFIAKQNAGNQQGDIISSPARYSYNHLAFRNVDADDVLLSVAKPTFKNEIEWKVFPNPANNTVFVKLQSTGGTLKLNDILGKQVLLENVTETTMPLNISTLPSGIYILEYSKGETVKTTKLIKN